MSRGEEPGPAGTAIGGHVGALEVVKRSQDLVLRGDFDGFVDLFSVDGTMEFPFAGTGMPARLDGRETIRRYMRAAAAGAPIEISEFRPNVLHQTTDPEVVIAEVVARGHVTKSKRSVEMRYLHVVLVRDGEIVSYRDYWSPLGMMSALGVLALIRALPGVIGMRRAARAKA